MAVIGNSATQQAFTPAVDYFSGNGSTTAFTLSRPVASVAQVQVVIDNVAQNPSSAYTISGSTITFTSAPLSGTNNIYVYYTSPITDVIAPGQNTVTTTSLASGFTLPVASGGTGLTTVPHTVQVFTSGSGTYTLPTNCKAIWVRCVGGGGGGSGGYNGSIYTSGTSGGNTTFSSLTANGGTAGSGNTPVNGGTASGGDINITGGQGSGGVVVISSNYYPGGTGGGSVFSGGGGASYLTGGNAGVNSGAGGGGGGTNNTTGTGGVGGGAGGYVEKLINSPSATYSYAVGAKGTGSAASGTSAAGGDGGSGIIIVTEYYV